MIQFLDAYKRAYVAIPVVLSSSFQQEQGDLGIRVLIQWLSLEKLEEERLGSI